MHTQFKQYFVESATPTSCQIHFHKVCIPLFEQFQRSRSIKTQRKPSETEAGQNIRLKFKFKFKSTFQAGGKFMQKYLSSLLQVFFSLARFSIHKRMSKATRHRKKRSKTEWNAKFVLKKRTDSRLNYKMHLHRRKSLNKAYKVGEREREGVWERWSCGWGMGMGTCLGL